MLRRIHKLHISLAAKCQILFGSAVALIIAAALFVPWQRMEQLTAQQPFVAATAVADAAVRHHVATSEADTAMHDRLHPTRDEPTVHHPVRFHGVDVYAPRLIGLHPNPGDQLTLWDRSVLKQLANHPDDRRFSRTYERRDGTPGFRFAEALVLQQECARCHTAVSVVPAFSGARGGAKQGSAVGHPRLPILGIVSVDIPSPIHGNQLLLNRIFLLTAGLLAGTLAIIVFYLIITYLILQPVRVLQETAEKVSDGDLDIRSDISTGDEFEQLSDTLNTMLANLKHNSDQLRSINKGLDLKIGQLAESNVALNESNRLKSEFLANVSHELRTPLNSILGFAELLKDASPPDGKPLRYTQNIMQSGRHLLELINDLLDLAKIEAGRMDVRSEPLSLHDLFEGLISILKPLTEAKSLVMVATVPTDVPIIRTDPAKLQQILYNLLSNAIKFSEARGKIELVAGREADGLVRITVADHGLGIEPNMQGLIFEKFRQIDGSVTRQHSGSGLGLAISKELTQLLGGHIGVVSSPGQGATFWITLPQTVKPGIADVRSAMVSL